MRLKKQKNNKTSRLQVRCDEADVNAAQVKANLYTDGNLSEWVLFAALNFVPCKEDFEEEKPKKGKNKNPLQK